MGLSLSACMSATEMAPVESLTPQSKQVVADANQPAMDSAPMRQPAIQTIQPFKQSITQQASVTEATDPQDEVIQTIDAPSYTKKTYIVKKGDTLYSIAFLSGMDYEALAALNHMSAPYTLSIGQVLKLSKNKTTTAQATKAASTQTIFWKPKQHQQVAPIKKTATPTAKTSFSWRPKKLVQKSIRLPNRTTWQWPVRGKVIAGFNLKPGGNRGLNIAGCYGKPIKAAASGQVVYSGNGIRGYGNIIIVKNTRHFLSAYAYNAQNLVHDGQWVQQGQTIATMGRNLAGQVMLHFEIRFYGKAIDPMRYLP